MPRIGQRTRLASTHGPAPIDQQKTIGCSPCRRSYCPLPHSWHSYHSFIDDTGLCAARACTGASDFQMRVVPFARFIAPRARPYSCTEPSSKENNLTNATNWAADKTRFYSRSGPDRSTKTIGCSPRRSSYCPLPHLWHSYHSFIDDAGLCAGRACTGTCDFQMGVVPSARFNAPR